MTSFSVTGVAPYRAGWRGGLGRVLAGALLVTAVTLLPWLSRTDPARTILRASASDAEPTPEALATVREQLGLDDGPLPLLVRWLGGLARGDAGTSWISGEPVLPHILTALGISVSLMLGALAVTAAVATLVCARTLRLGAQRKFQASGGSGVAILAALPKFLLASVLATVFGVLLGWLPVQGWEGPAWMVLPALALGVPSGAVIGAMLRQALPGAFHEPWVRTWTGCGFPPAMIARQALRRCLPAVLPQLLPTVVALVGGAVAVEKIFNIPGLGQLTLDAALTQDLPLLQTGTLALVLLGLTGGLLLRALRRTLLGPALDARALPALHTPALPMKRAVRYVAAGSAMVLLGAIAIGLFRDPLHVDTAARLLAPSAVHPLGTDALGRDLLARLAHGALRTTGVALAVTAVSVLVGILIGLAGRWSMGLIDVISTLPVVLAGLLVTGLTGPSLLGAALAVCLVGWSPYAAQTAALLEQECASGHFAAAVALGAGRLHLLRRHLLPALAAPILLTSVLRLPTCVLVLASLGFLGLGPPPPDPEWGRLLSENQPYAELAPWTVLGPALALILLSLLTVTGSALLSRRLP